MPREVKHTVYDPRQLRLAKPGFFDVPSHTRSSPPSRHGALKSIPEDPSARSVGDVVPAHQELIGPEPWRSPAVAEFATGLQRGDLEALILQGPRGTALRAAGEVTDHQVASKAVAEIESKRLPSIHGPSVDHAELTPFNRSRRNAVTRAEDLSLAKPRVSTRAPMSFGAVYEYRDDCGTAKVVGSTAAVPEKQFALDQRHYEHSLQKREPRIVWVAISGGSGGLDELEMAQVRRRVAAARAERLNAKKLSDIKPYSRPLVSHVLNN